MAVNISTAPITIAIQLCCNTYHPTKISTTPRRMRIIRSVIPTLHFIIIMFMRAIGKVNNVSQLDANGVECLGEYRFGLGVLKFGGDIWVEVQNWDG